MVFILLVFFVVTTVFVEESGMKAETPDLDRPTLARTEPFVLTARNTGEIVFNGRAVPLSLIGTTIKTAMMGETHPVKIEVEDSVVTSTLVKIMDECTSIGVDTLVLARFD